MLNSRSRDDRGAYTMFIAIVVGALAMLASVAYDVPRLITARQHAAQTASETARVAAATIAAGGTLEEARAAATERAGAFPQPFGAQAHLGEMRCVGGQVETTLLTSYDNKSALGIFRDTQIIQASGAAKATIVGPDGEELALGTLPQCPRQIPDPASLVPLPIANICIKSLTTTGAAEIELQWATPVVGSVNYYQYEANKGGLGWTGWREIDPSYLTETPSTVTFKVTRIPDGTTAWENLINHTEYRLKIQAVNDQGPSLASPTTSPWFVKAKTKGNIANKQQVAPRCGATPPPLPEFCIGAIGKQSVTFRPYGPVTNNNNQLPDSSILGFAYTARVYGGAWPDKSKPFQSGHEFLKLSNGPHDKEVTITHELEVPGGATPKEGRELQQNTRYQMYVRAFNSHGQAKDGNTPPFAPPAFDFETGTARHNPLKRQLQGWRHHHHTHDVVLVCARFAIAWGDTGHFREFGPLTWFLISTASPHAANRICERPRAGAVLDRARPSAWRSCSRS